MIPPRRLPLTRVLSSSLPEVVNRRVVDYYTTNSIVPATAITTVEQSGIPDGSNEFSDLQTATIVIFNNSGLDVNIQFDGEADIYITYNNGGCPIAGFLSSRSTTYRLGDFSNDINQPDRYIPDNTWASIRRVHDTSTMERVTFKDGVLWTVGSLNANFTALDVNNVFLFSMSQYAAGSNSRFLIKNLRVYNEAVYY